MTGDELERAMDEGCGPVLVDLRDPEKFEAGHLAGARNIPVAELEGHLDELRAAGPVLVY